MKKQKTLLIVVLIVAIAIVGLYLAIGVMGEKEKKGGDEGKTSPMLTNLEDVTYVQYTNVDGTVTLVKTGETWKSEEQPELKLVDGYVDERVSILGQIKGTLLSDVTKAECGLETPIYTLTIKNAKETVKLILGVSEDGDCYAMVEGKDDIYEIKEEVINVLNMSASDFSELTDDMSRYNIDQEELDTDEESADGSGNGVEGEPTTETPGTEQTDEPTSDVAGETTTEE